MVTTCKLFFSITLPCFILYRINLDDSLKSKTDKNFESAQKKKEF